MTAEGKAAKHCLITEVKALQTFHDFRNVVLVTTNLYCRGREGFSPQSSSNMHTNANDNTGAVFLYLYLHTSAAAVQLVTVLLLITQANSGMTNTAHTSSQ